jgi:hypothetical protein
MKINFEFPLLNLDGTEVALPDGSIAMVNKLVANWIMQTATRNAADIMKYYGWAKQLYETGSVDLDVAGKAEFQSFVENLPDVSVLVKGVILEKLKNE